MVSLTYIPGISHGYSASGIIVNGNHNDAMNTDSGFPYIVKASILLSSSSCKAIRDAKFIPIFK